MADSSAKKFRLVPVASPSAKEVFTCASACSRASWIRQLMKAKMNTFPLQSRTEQIMASSVFMKRANLLPLTNGGIVGVNQDRRLLDKRIGQKYVDDDCQLLVGADKEEQMFLEQMVHEKDLIHKLVVKLQKDLKDGIDVPDFEAKLQELSQLTQAVGYGNEQLPGPRDSGKDKKYITM